MRVTNGIFCEALRTLLGHLGATGKYYLETRDRGPQTLSWNGRELTTPTSATTQTQPKPFLKPSSVVYWMRFVLAILAGLSNQILHIDAASFGDASTYVGIGLGVAFYLLSVIIVRHMLHYGPTELRGKNRDITLGGGTFIFVWIMTTVFFYTIGL